jgi:hypothetical protein
VNLVQILRRHARAAGFTPSVLLVGIAVAIDATAFGALRRD